MINEQRDRQMRIWAMQLFLDGLTHMLPDRQLDGEYIKNFAITCYDAVVRGAKAIDECGRSD